MGTYNAYWPGEQLITLRPTVYANTSNKALTLAAHEAGHAAQHRSLWWLAPALRFVVPGRLWLEWDASNRARVMMRELGATPHEDALTDSWREYLVPALWQMGVLIAVIGAWLIWRRL